MVSPGARQTLALAAALLALAVPQAAAGQPDAAGALHERLVGEIQAILSRDGPYSPDLLEPLTALIVLYHEEEDEALAAVAIERARQVVRINKGLHTLEQVPLIQQLIRIEEARGNHAEAWQLEQDLLALARRYPDDLRTVAVLRDVADRQMDVLATYLGGTKPPQLYLGCYYKAFPSGDPGDCNSGRRRTVVQGMLADAQRNYSDAIAVMLRNEEYDNDELRELEMELLRGVDLVRTLYDSDPRREDLPLVPVGPLGLEQRWEPWRSRTAPLVELAGWDLPYLGSTLPSAAEIRRLETKLDRMDDTYHRGRQSLRRLYAYGAATAKPPLEQAGAVVQMADWELLYSHNGLAVLGYELAYAMLETAGVAAASIEQLFAPELPVVLPEFQPNPLARDETRPATGHIDVAFAITKYGRGRDIEILDTANASRAARGRLVNLVMTSRFRPRPTTGRFDNGSRVVVRYYLND